MTRGLQSPQASNRQVPNGSVRVARDSRRAAAKPSSQMHDTITTRQTGGVSKFSTEILTQLLT